MNRAANVSTRHAAFLLLCGLGLVLFYNPAVQLLRMSFHSELYSHIPIIPLISLCILIFSRKRVFSETRWGWAGIVLLALGFVVLLSANRIAGLNQNDYLSLVMCGAVLWIIGGFILSYGSRAFKEAMFPLLFLIFVIPIPKSILDPFVNLLLIGSAYLTEFIFSLTGVPVHRDGFTFALPGITIEVAQQCSGIRSSIALIITSVFAGYIFLKKGWSRVILVLSFFPITVFKNALRIVTLSLLASYVDTRFVTGSWLHQSGGIPFFAVGLALMAPVLWALMKAEKRKKTNWDTLTRPAEGGTRVTEDTENK
jgi:exosortase